MFIQEMNIDDVKYLCEEYVKAILEEAVKDPWKDGDERTIYHCGLLMRIIFKNFQQTVP